MQKQLVFIHGGDAYSDSHDYGIALQQAEVNIEYMEKNRWHYVPALQSALGPEWQVIRPDMPADENAKYDHWKIWFEKYIPFLHDDVVLMGHSLGAMFLARYLSENDMPVRVSKLFLLAGEFTRPQGHQPGEGDGEFFYTHFDNFARLDPTADQIYLLHSHYDFVVPFENLALWAERLPSAQVVEYTDRNHFLQEEFSEIIELIKE